ncbi:hypothetical protein OB894_20680 [Bacillus subtilis]|uniref:Uncharacterized protein n=1 Tax=Bacillus subtilis TaxID=1423 RepID=A0A0D1JBR0_BACIU|nr:hypothetical protein [Bacillus velezensis]KIU09814.1 hypothetical protein SC09_contig12orf00012 [Bacillus subtilis]QZY43599.1 hypothetical protein K4A81_20930 [Bacillus velezensis]HEO2443955.1 hypothetical protein [Streptococcus agalactiae]
MSDFETGMRYVRATLCFEGLVLTEEEEKLLERRFHGEITERRIHPKSAGAVLSLNGKAGDFGVSQR